MRLLPYFTCTKIWVRGYLEIVRQSTWKFWPNLKLNDKVFFSFDYSSIGSQRTIPGGWHVATLEQFEIFKMAARYVNKRPPGLIAPLLKFCNLLGNSPINTTKGRDLIFNEGIRLLNMADNI